MLYVPFRTRKPPLVQLRNFIFIFTCHSQAQGALMYDSVFVLVEAFNRILRKKPDQFRSYTMRRQNGQAANTTAKFLDCNTSKGWVTQWEHGERIAKNLRKVEIEGLTGEIRFNDEGKRINYTLHIVEMTGKIDSITKQFR